MAQCVIRIPGKTHNQVLQHYYCSTLVKLYGLTSICLAFRICLEPASVSPHEWPDDITKWPVGSYDLVNCLETKNKMRVWQRFIRLLESKNKNLSLMV